jgi:hypothetical protein
MVSQILVQGHTPKSLENMFIRAQNGKVQPQLSGLFDVFSEHLSTCGTSYMVIDALDECPELDDVLDLLQKLWAASNENMHVILTSRHISEIENFATRVHAEVVVFIRKHPITTSQPILLTDLSLTLS